MIIKKESNLECYSSVPRKPARKVETKEFVVEGKKKPRSNTASSNRHISDTPDNDLIREMRKKLQGRNLRHVIIDGANIGRTYVAGQCEIMIDLVFVHFYVVLGIQNFLRVA